MAKHRKPVSWPRAIWRSILILLLFAGTIFAYILYLSRDLPSLDQLENYDPDLVTRIYSADGKVLHELFYEKRVFVELDEMPWHMREATIASEDKRFRDHWGVSMRDFFRAVVMNTLTMRYSTGFSSITQQLARNLYDTIGFRKTLIRKIKEGITAIQIERTYTKNEILEMYLNSVHFGHGTWGVQAASKRYFNKNASELTLNESALLVGILPSPGNYSPIRNPERARTRRNTVLRLMRDQGRITKDQYTEARARSLNKVTPEQGLGIAPYFTEYVRRILELEDEKLNINIYRDGLKIYTTLDTRLQSIAEEMVMRSLMANQEVLNERLFNDEEEFSKLAYLGIYPEDTVKMMMQGQIPMYDELRNKLLVQCSFVALDPKTGAIKAMLGGRPDYPDQYNRAVQAPRQPGSVFKPFIYITALDNGYPVTKQLLDQPVVLNVQNADGEWVKWMPHNDDFSTGGLTTLREGLRWSKNLISVRMVQELVPAAEVVRTAKRMGITTPVRAVDAIALGTSEVYMLDAVAAYATLANNGVYSKPYLITRIVDRFGNTIKEYYPQQEEVLSAETAYLMTNLMQTVLDRGTGGSARWKYHFYAPAVGKTGTTQRYTDAWFVGFTPQLATGVWFGVDDPQVSLGDQQFGNRAALPAWARFMRTAYDSLEIGLKPIDFERPKGINEIEICSVTKDLPTKYCPLEKELFIKGTDPTRRCRVHR
ncbi:MAG: PBP1A family penicillin-binding protein [Candidatus Marinimicrobia bacterium]|nr:PBP1A family penicillin-binding protein [Candidatus Neomarinimicrobiota bacterium]